MNKRGKPWEINGLEPEDVFSNYRYIVREIKVSLKLVGSFDMSCLGRNFVLGVNGVNCSINEKKDEEEIKSLIFFGSKAYGISRKIKVEGE